MNRLAKIADRARTVLLRDLVELQSRGRVQDEEVREALIHAREERVRLALAVQSHRWTHTS